MLLILHMSLDYLPVEAISAAILWIACSLVCLCIGRYAVKHWNAPKRRTYLYFLICAAAVSLPSGLLYSLTEKSIQTVLFGLLLSFAAYSDICRREVDDCLSVMILICACFSTAASQIPMMLGSAIVSVLPMFVAALLLRRGAIGGADIKVTAACACVLGLQRIMPAVIAGLLLAVIVNAILQKRKGTPNVGFPLVPYLAAAFMTAYFI